MEEKLRTIGEYFNSLKSPQLRGKFLENLSFFLDNFSQIFTNPEEEKDEDLDCAYVLSRLYLEKRECIDEKKLRLLQEVLSAVKSRFKEEELYDVALKIYENVEKVYPLKKYLHFILDKLSLDELKEVAENLSYIAQRNEELLLDAVELRGRLNFTEYKEFIRGDLEGLRMKISLLNSLLELCKEKRENLESPKINLEKFADFRPLFMSGDEYPRIKLEYVQPEKSSYSSREKHKPEFGEGKGVVFDLDKNKVFLPKRLLENEKIRKYSERLFEMLKGGWKDYGLLMKFFQEAGVEGFKVVGGESEEGISKSDVEKKYSSQQRKGIGGMLSKMREKIGKYLFKEPEIKERMDKTLVIDAENNVIGIPEGTGITESEFKEIYDEMIERKGISRDLYNNLLNLLEREGNIEGIRIALKGGKELKISKEDVRPLKEISADVSVDSIFHEDSDPSTGQFSLPWRQDSTKGRVVRVREWDEESKRYAKSTVTVRILSRGCEEEKYLLRENVERKRELRIWAEKIKRKVEREILPGWKESQRTFYYGIEVDVEELIKKMIYRGIRKEEVLVEEDVWRMPKTEPRAKRVVILIDQSGSTRYNIPNDDYTVLETAMITAAALAKLAEKYGIPTIIYSFSTDKNDEAFLYEVKREYEKLSMCEAKLFNLRYVGDTPIASAVRAVDRITNLGKNETLVILSDSFSNASKVENPQADFYKALEELKWKGVNVIYVHIWNEDDWRKSKKYGDEIKGIFGRIVEVQKLDDVAYGIKRVLMG